MPLLAALPEPLRLRIVRANGRFSSRPLSRFPHPLQYHLSKLRLGTHAPPVPYQLSLLLSRVAPGRLPGLNALAHESLGLAQQNWNILLRVHSVADEKRHHNDVLHPRKFIAV